MKKKLALLLLAAISCTCAAVGFSACGGDSSAHTMTRYAAKSATCTEDGNTEYYYCSDCGKYFSDADGNTEIELSSTVIEATGHTYVTDFTWTAASNGYTATVTNTCSVCGASEDPVAATVTVTSQKDATCLEDGQIVYSASATIDGETVTDTKTVALPATGHSYSDEWTSDGSYHWHEATCEHKGEVVGNKDEHSFVADGSGYKCEVCGYTVSNTISYGTESLKLGDNFIYLADTDSYISGNISYTAEKEGYYTVTIPEDCTAFVYIETPYAEKTLGLTDATATSQLSAATFAAYAGDKITITFIGTPSDVERDGAYIFCLNLSCSEETISYGSEVLPYELSLAGTQDQTVTINAGASCYFTVTATNSVSQIYVASADLKLYLVGDNGDTECTLSYDGTNYCYYTYVKYGTTYTYCFTNTSGSAITDTISFYIWNPTLTEGTNTITLDTACLSNNAIGFTFSIPANSAYIMTLGDGTDGNVTIQSSSGSVGTPKIYLGNGTENTSYILNNAKTSSTSEKIYVKYTGSGSTFTVVIIITPYEEDTTESTDDISYKELTLDTEVTGDVANYSFYTVSSYAKAYFTYNAASAGTYSFTLNSSNSMITYFYSNFTVIVNGTEYTSDSLVYSIPLVAGENTIIVKASQTWNYTITGTLSQSGSGTETTATPLSVGSNNVTEDTLYSFTATDAGTYTFTVSGTKGYGQLYESATSYSALLDESGDVDKYEVTLAAGETITIYTSNGGDGDFVVKITFTASSGSSTVNALSLGDNAITNIDYSGADMTFTVTEAATYTFSVTSGSDNAFVTYGSSYRITPDHTLFEVYLSAGTYTINVAAYSENTTASFTLNIAKS